MPGSGARSCPGAMAGHARERCSVMPGSGARLCPGAVSGHARELCLVMPGSDARYARSCPGAVPVSLFCTINVSSPGSLTIKISSLWGNGWLELLVSEDLWQAMACHDVPSYPGRAGTEATTVLTLPDNPRSRTGGCKLRGTRPNSDDPLIRPFTPTGP